MLVFNGREIPVIGVISASFLDDPSYGFTNKKDFTKRRTAPTSICIHTRLGIKDQKIVPAQDRDWDRIVAKRASADDRAASWHISIDSDGSFVCHLDIIRDQAYHASHMNARSVGIEIYQDTDGGISEESLQTCVKICDVLTRELGIQRQFVKENKICSRLASSNSANKHTYVSGGKEGKDYYGLFGHRNCTRNRGVGDPGDLIWDRLRSAGYEEFSIEKKEDIAVWKKRQLDIGIPASQADGIPGPKTRNALESKGYKRGMFVPRPCD